MDVATAAVLTPTITGAAAFLRRICLPAADEFGLLLQDKVSAWRQTNLLKIAEKTERLIEERKDTKPCHAHPRLVGAVMEHGSWADDDLTQNMWAGLLASSCTETGKNEDNLIFINLLSRLTSAQAKILNYACENAPKRKLSDGLICADIFLVSIDQLVGITDVSDIHMIDFLLDNLREIGLFSIIGGISEKHLGAANLHLSATGLNLYVRCQGYIGSPTDYFGL